MPERRRGRPRRPRTTAKSGTGLTESQTPHPSCPFLTPSPRSAGPRRRRSRRDGDASFRALQQPALVPAQGTGRRGGRGAPVPPPCPSGGRRWPREIQKAPRQRLPPSPAVPAGLARGNKLNPRGKRRSPRRSSSSGSRAAPRQRAGGAGPRAAAPCGGAEPGRSPAAPARPGPAKQKPVARLLHRGARRLLPPRAHAALPSGESRRAPRASPP